jgi:hypothetical protein
MNHQVVTCSADATPESEIRVAHRDLQPQITLRLRLVPAGQHPAAEHPGLFPGGIDAPGVGIQEEGQQHVHRRRLPGAIDPPQQEAPAGEMQDFVVVLIDIDDAGAAQGPAPGTFGHAVGLAADIR